MNKIIRETLHKLNETRQTAKRLNRIVTEAMKEITSDERKLKRVSWNETEGDLDNPLTLKRERRSLITTIDLFIAISSDREIQLVAFEDMLRSIYKNDDIVNLIDSIRKLNRQVVTSANNYADYHIDTNRDRIVETEEIQELIVDIVEEWVESFDKKMDVIDELNKRL